MFAFQSHCRVSSFPILSNRQKPFSICQPPTRAVIPQQHFHLHQNKHQIAPICTKTSIRLHPLSPLSTMATNKFNDNKYLSTNEDIRTILNKCNTCNKTNDYGKLVLLLNELTNYRIETRRSKISIFLNIPNENNVTPIGHWILLCINISFRKCILFDSLATTDQNTLTEIKLFCKSNKLTLHVYAARYQNTTSKSCGFLCLFIHYQFSHNKLHSLLKMRRSILSSPVKFVEATMMKKMAQHFHIKF